MIENLKNIQSELEKLTTFPAMPELAHKILALGPRPEVNDLVAIVEIDPGLAAQIMRQAASPFFGYRGSVIAGAFVSRRPAYPEQGDPR